MNNDILTQESIIKDLGVWFDNKLTYNYNLKYKKINRYQIYDLLNKVIKIFMTN